VLAAVIPQLLLLLVLREEAQAASRRVDREVLVDQAVREVLEAQVDPGVVGRSTFDLCPLYAAAQPRLSNKVVKRLKQKRFRRSTLSGILSNRPLQHTAKEAVVIVS
jgi:hypothetical protein